jgi:L-fucose mutarotase/ribose pyranase (RbsD/FucU family)
MSGIDTPHVLQTVLSVLPIDTFVPEPCAIMQNLDDPGAMPEVVAEMNAHAAVFGRAAGRFYGLNNRSTKSGVGRAVWPARR